MSIRWLHLTDLHVGMSGMSPLWPSVQADFWTDLERLHAVAGGIDLVLFTGDLAFSGKADEFARVDEWLEALVARLRALGSDPLLLAVPGNHDLRRPDDSKLPIRALLHWTHDQDLRTSFWDDRGRDDRALVNGVFDEYTGWLAGWRKRHPLPAWASVTGPGLLSGDFAATIEVGGLRLGVVGLNSAFLHLSGRVVRGQIALHPNQLHAVTGGDPDGWARSHDVCFLVTHHPPDWLTPDGLAYYHGSILLPEWFAGHLCGHQHEPVILIQSRGGAPAHRLFQGASLFGLDEWTDAAGKHEQRIHGYSVGVLERAEAKGRLRVYPRLAKPQAGTGRWRFVPNHDFELSGDAYEVEIPLRTPKTVSPAAAGPAQLFSAQTGPSLAATRAPQAPGLGYDPAWYVPQEVKERTALNMLRQPAPSVVLSAAPKVGKSTVLRCLVDRLREEDRQSAAGGVVIAVDFGHFSEAALNDEAAGFRELADLLVEGFEQGLRAAGKTPPKGIGRWVDMLWQRPYAVDAHLHTLLDRRILAMGFGRVVVAFDRFERIIGTPLGNPIAELLRRWREGALQVPLRAPLRLLLAAASLSQLFAGIDDISEFFSMTVSVRLDSFGLVELQRLAQLYGSAWSVPELEKLIDLVDGQPYLSRLIFFLEASGILRAQLLDVQRLKVDYCADFLLQLWLLYKNRPDVLGPFGTLLKNPDAKLSPADVDVLHRAGLVRHVGGTVRVTNALVASYFRERC